MSLAGFPSSKKRMGAFKSPRRENGLTTTENPCEWKEEEGGIAQKRR